jgi:hypothetical protein
MLSPIANVDILTGVIVRNDSNVENKFRNRTRPSQLDVTLQQLESHNLLYSSICSIAKTLALGMRDDCYIDSRGNCVHIGDCILKRTVSLKALKRKRLEGYAGIYGFETDGILLVI